MCGGERERDRQRERERESERECVCVCGGVRVGEGVCIHVCYPICCD